jgi:hypothetical protein
VLVIVLSWFNKKALAMKKSVLFITLLILGLFTSAQDFKFYENFDTIPYGSKVTSTNTGSGQWGITTSLSVSGLRSDSCVVAQSDTVYLTSNAFSTVGFTNIFLEFSHICKVEFNDNAEVWVSNNNGATWVKLTAAQYMGAGQFATIGDRFNAVSYTTVWDPGNNYTIPTNAWWQAEKFNLGALIGNSTQARIRFALSDQNNNGANGNYGWLLDDIRVWTPSAQEATMIGFDLPFSLPSGCGLTNETIRVRILNSGGSPINGNITASFRREGQTAVTESIPSLIATGDTLTYTFINKIDLNSSIDTNYLVWVWVKVVGDPNAANDTIMDTIASRVPLPPPISPDVTIPFGTSTTLYAAHQDSLRWFSDPQALNQIGTGAYYTTPILFDTAIFYVQAGTPGSGTSSTPELLYYKFDSPGTSVQNSALNPVGSNPASITGSGLSIGGTGMFGTALQGTGVASGSGVINTGWLTNLSGSFTIAFWTSNIPASSTLWYIFGDAGASTFRCFTNGVAQANNWMIRGGGLPDLTIPGTATMAPNMIHAVFDASTLTFKGYKDGVLVATATATSPVAMAGTGFQIGGYGTSTNLNGLMDEFRIYNRALSVAEIQQSLLPASTGCPSIAKPVKVMINGVPQYNAGIASINKPFGAYAQGDTSSVVVTLKNFASQPLTKVQIHHSVNGVAQQPYLWTGNLPYNQTTQVVLSLDTFFSGTYAYKAWTELPNDSIDGYQLNDSATSMAYVCLSGIFTMGDANSDFPTIADLQTILTNVGICGNTTIRIKPGTYTGPFIFPAIQGASASSRLVFESFSGLNTDVIIQHSGVAAADNYTIRLNGADYITFRNITIRNNGATYGRVIELLNGASYNVFEGNRMFSGGNTSSTTAIIYDASTALNHYNQYINNYMSGGYYGIYSYGSSSSPSTSWQKGTVIRGNTLVGNNIYPMLIYYGDSIIIENNRISGGVSTYSYGISAMYLNNGYTIVGNKISLVAATTTATYGIRDYYCNHASYNASPGSLGLVANNMIDILVTTAGSHYGIYGYYSAGSRYYHNSVNITGIASTSSYAFNQSNTATNLLKQEFLNNVFSNKAGGYALYVADTGRVGVCDYNDLHSTGTALTYWVSARANLADHRTASNRDANSISVDPLFISASDLHTKNILLNGTATPVAQVTIDFDGQPRDTLNPDIGADEFSLHPQNAKLLAIIAPENGCVMDTMTVTIRVVNEGTDTITGNLSGSYYLLGSANVVTEPIPGTILPGDSLNFSFSSKVNLSTTIDSTFQIKAWVNLLNDPDQFNDSTIKPVFNGTAPIPPTGVNGSTVYGTQATISATGTGLIWWFPSTSAVFPIWVGSSYTTPVLFDTTVYYAATKGANGCLSTYTPVTAIVTNIPAGDVGISRIFIDQGCGLDSTEDITIEVYNQGYATVTGNLTASYRIDNNPWISAESITVPIAPFDTIQYTFTAKANLFAYVADTMFKVKAYVSLLGDNYQLNDSILEDTVISKLTPVPPTVVSPVAVNYGMPALLNATAASTIYWYQSINDTTELDTGAAYVTPPLYQNATYYAAAGSGGGGSAMPLDIGAHGSVYSGYTRGFWFLAPSKITITSLMVPVDAGVGSQYIQVVRFPNGPPAVYTATSPHVDLAIISNVNTTLPVPVNITVNAGDYIGILGARNAGSPTSMLNSYGPTNSNFYPSTINGVTVPLGRLIYQGYLVAGAAPNNTLSQEATASAQIGRVHMTYVLGGAGCQSNRVPVVVNVGPPPPIDAGILTIDAPSGAAQSGVPSPVVVRIKNFGTDTLQSVNLTYQLDGIVKSNYFWTGSLAFGDTSGPITIYTDTFSGGIHNICLWTSNANGTNQGVNMNDTLCQGFSACLSGTYTIGGANSDFPTFTHALTTLYSAGVCGHVIFDVEPGIYNAQLSIDTIKGAGPNSTITFRGVVSDSTQVRIQAAGSAAANYTIRFNGADYVTFRNMTIRNTDATNGRVVEFVNGANYNGLISNHMESGGFSSSTTSVVYDGTSLNHFNSFIGNYMKGGYYSIYSSGAASSPAASWQQGVVIRGNRLIGSGIYPIYVYYSDGVVIEGNTIDSVASTYCYGINAYYVNNAYRVVGNRVTINSTATTACYGIRDYYGNYVSYNANPTGYGLVANNMVVIRGTTTGPYGMYAYYSNGTEYYYNSIRIATAAAATSYYALYQANTSTNTLGQIFKNNIFVNQSSGYAAYFGTNAQVTGCDNNCYFTNGTNLAYWGAAMTNLAALKTAAPLFNINSVSLLPDFSSAIDLHLLSTSLSGLGVPIATVPFDIDGELRSALPTIGADEVALLPVDAGVNFVYSPNALENEADTIPVIVRIKNYGSDTLFSVPINYYVPGTSISVNFTYIDTLKTGDTALVVMPDMIVPAGSRQLCAKTMLPLDSNFFNDQTCKAFYGTPIQDAYVTRILKIQEGCGLGLDTVSIVIRNIGYQAIPGGFTAKYKEEHLAPVSATVNQSIPAGDSITFHFPAQFDFSVTTVDSTYRIMAWTEVPADGVESNDTASIVVASTHTPPAPITSNVTVPYASPANLTATSTTNDKLYWYASDTAQAHLDTGNLYVTPLMYATDTFYVAAKSSTAFTGGLGVGVNIAPLSTITGVGLSTGTLDWARSFDGDTGTITSGQQCWISTATPPNGTEYWDWNWTQPYTISSVKFYLAQNTARTLTGATFQVWNGTNWVNHHTWVQPQGPFSFTINFAPVTTTKLRCTAFQMTGIGQLSNPNFREIEVFLSSIEGCSSPRVPVIVTVGNQAQYDAGAFKFTAPVSAVNMGANETVKVKVRNYGTQSISNFQVSFKVDQLATVTETIAGPLASGDSLEYTFNAKANLSSQGVTYQMKAWTTLTGDVTAINDTVYLSVTNMLPNYCPCAATSGVYEDISRVRVSNLNNYSGGVAGGSMYSDFTNLPPALLNIGVTDSIEISSEFVTYTTQYNCWVNVFIDWNRDGTFDPLAERAFSRATTSQNVVADTFTVPLTASPGLTRMRVVLRESGTAGDTGPCGTFTWGEAEDYLVQVAPLAATDAGVVAITSPSGTVSGGTNVPITAVVRNFGTNPILPGQLQVKFQLDNSPVYTVTVQNTLQSLDTLTVSAGIWPVPTGQHQLCVWTVLANDSVTFNDQKCIGVFGELYTGLPYSDDFEGTVYWNAVGPKGNWQHGVPAGTSITSAHSPTKAWMTKLNANYDNGANEMLYTPRFNFAGLLPTDTATLKFWHWLRCETTNDGGHVQYSNNGGQTWVNLGFIGDLAATNWYNTNAGGTHCFSGQAVGWQQSTMKLDPAVFNGQSLVQFRFRFFSNASNNTYDGWAIDDFEVVLPIQPNDVGVDAIVSPPGGSIIGSQVSVTVTLKNFGSNTQTSFPVSYKINNLPPVTETWTGSLAYNATANFTFSTPYTGLSTTYQLCAYTSLANDAFLPNDQVCGSQSALPAPFDAGVEFIHNPKDSVCKDSWAKPVRVRVKNYGTSTLTTMNLQYQINSTTPVIETWNGSLLPGDTMLYQFNTLYNPPIGVFMMCAQTNLNLDANAANDKTCNTVKSVTCVGIDENGLPGMELGQNRPNPAAQSTTIDFNLPGDGKVIFEVVNMLGQVIESRQISAVQGTQSIDLDLSRFESGIYYYSIRFEGYSLTRKMIVER